MKYLTQRAGRAVDAEAHPRLAPDEALQLGAALPAQGTLLHRTGAHYCNIIEAPWLANGGHRASFRHHNDRRTLERVQLREDAPDLAVRPRHRGVVAEPVPLPNQQPDISRDKNRRGG
jgi:hypothetical protein